MKYVIFSSDWHRPVYFCAHEGSGFTVSTDPKKARTFRSLELAEIARIAFADASGMQCEIKRL